MLERLLPSFGRRRDKAAADLPVRVGHVAPRQSRMLDYDQNLVWVTLLLLAFGLVMVYSATISFHDSPRYAQWSPYHYFVRDLFSIAAALLASWIVVQIPMVELQKWSSRFFFLSLIGLVVVLLPHIGKDVNGSKRWVVFPGGLNFQPSELVKLTALLYAADFMVRKQDVKQSFLKTFAPMMAVMVVVGVLLLAEPDMGAFLVIASLTMAILFLGGANGKLFALASVAVIGAFVLMIVLSPWRRDRIFAYLNPWAEANALGSAYQLSHALIAMGRGQWFGVGLGGSIEKLHYLPEAHTDFLLAIIGEELGLVGVGAV
ncbi:MAG: FtsW/RodA/SpoVE family cell cycle protein, partial [Thiomonas sp.]